MKLVIVILPFLFLLATVVGQYSNGLDSAIKKHDKDRLIHVAVTIDKSSIKDSLLVLHSAVRSAQYPSSVVLHALACGVSQDEANSLAEQLDAALENCLGNNRREILPFVLPETSGFKQQMKTNKLSHHWTSPAGADMARFFLPKMFPHAERILYLDNDIIISCCLEEVFDTYFGENGIVGLALDDLKWSTSTQYRRHYNSTHPLVIKNMRRSGKKVRYIPTRDESGGASPRSSAMGAGSSRGGVKTPKGKKGPGHMRGGKAARAASAGAALASTPSVAAPDSTGERQEPKASSLGSASTTTGKAMGMATSKQHSVKHFRKEFTSAAVGPNEEAMEATGQRYRRQRHRRLKSVLDKNLHEFLNLEEVGEDEFLFHLPRYPNDGVMLFDVQRYNIANILGLMEEIATANGNGEYVVNRGTQQFTVLALWDRWVELSPRANLRHFPDMARGYMMWFLYNGIIHYAGQSKPGVVCTAEDAMELRKMTYLPWTTSIYHMTGHSGGNIQEHSATTNARGGASLQCKTAEPLLLESGYYNCSRHVPATPTFSSFFEQVKRITSANSDDSTLLVLIGEISKRSVTDLTYDRDASSMPITPASAGLAATVTAPSSVEVKSLETKPLAFEAFQSHLLYASAWSWRVFDNQEDRRAATKSKLESVWKGAQESMKQRWFSDEAVKAREEAQREKKERIQQRQAAHAADTAKGSGGGGSSKHHRKDKMPPMAKFPAKRNIVTFEESSLCDGSEDVDMIVAEKDANMAKKDFQVVDYAGNIDPKSALRRPCETVLTRLKRNKHAHWDVGGVVIDYDVPGKYDKDESLSVSSVVTQEPLQQPKEEGATAEKPEIGTAASAIAAVRGALSKLIGDRAATPTATFTPAAATGAYSGGTSKRAASSLGALLALDLTFIRPKFIVCRIHRGVKPFTAKAMSNDIGSNSNNSTRAPGTPEYRADTNGYVTAHKIRRDVRRYDEAANAVKGGLYTGDDAYQGSAVHQAQRFLTRHGYVAHFEDGGAACGEGYVCVWGTLVSHLELYGF